MNDKLRDLIGQANSRVDAKESKREQEKVRSQQEEFDQDSAKFRSKVESVLGKDVLDAIGPVTFHKNFLENSITFVQDSRIFRFQQVTGFLVQLQEDGKPGFLGNQFNLENADSKDAFLHILGAVLSTGENSKKDR